MVGFDLRTTIHAAIQEKQCYAGLFGIMRGGVYQVKAPLLLGFVCCGTMRDYAGSAMWSG